MTELWVVEGKMEGSETGWQPVLNFNGVRGVYRTRDEAEWAAQKMFYVNSANSFNSISAHYRVVVFRSDAK